MGKLHLKFKFLSILFIIYFNVESFCELQRGQRVWKFHQCYFISADWNLVSKWPSPGRPLFFLRSFRDSFLFVATQEAHILPL